MKPIPIQKSFYLFDRLIIGYCSLMLVMIAILGRPLENYLSELLFYVAMTGLALIIPRFTEEQDRRLKAAIRLLYPVFMFSFFYRQTGGLMFLLFDQFQDWQLVTFEHMILGVNPTLYLDQYLPNTALSEILFFCYLTYYLMIPLFFSYAFFKRDYGVIKRCLSAVSLTFFASYLLFFLYPVEGPRWHFATEYVNSLDGPLFTQLVAFIMEKGAVHGGAMPSSHTGVALVIMIFCLRHYRKAGLIMIPIVTGLAIATVWGRFHYVSDVIIGVAIALLAERLTMCYFNRQSDPAKELATPESAKAQNVS